MRMQDFSLISSTIPDMKIVSESEYRLIAYSEKHGLEYHEWHPDSSEIDDDTFKAETFELMKIIERLRPVYIIANDKKRKISISEEINDFLVGNFQALHSRLALKKVAVISNEQLSIQGQAESTLEELKKDSPDNAEFRFFIDVGQALDWLGLEKRG